MDILSIRERISTEIGKYKYVGLILFVGILLMVIPGKSNREEVLVEKEPEQLQETVVLQSQLEDILSYVEGAGNVKVMLSIAQGERTVYQTDSTYSQTENTTDTRTQTIIISDSERNEMGLVHQKSSPIYQGAIVLAEGANISSVKLSIVDAVSDVTGLGADKITVLKMK